MVNLALSLTHRGTKVLLIDADLRRGTVHSVFEVGREPGLADVVRGAVPFEQARREIRLELRHRLLPRLEIPFDLRARRLLELLGELQHRGVPGRLSQTETAHDSLSLQLRTEQDRRGDHRVPNRSVHP